MSKRTSLAGGRGRCSRVGRCEAQRNSSVSTRLWVVQEGGGNEHAPVIDLTWPEEIWSNVALF